GFADRSASQFMDAIERSKQVSLERFLMGLGIRQVGQHIARVLARRFGNLDAIMAADRATFESVHEIGPEIASSLETFFQEDHNREVIARLRRLGLTVTTDTRGHGPESRPLEGKIVVLTGTLEHRSRDEAKRRIEEAGGRVTSSVSKRTDYVIAGSEPGSKIEDAKRLDVPILSEAEFDALLQTP
ncbi:MAG TPA: helix-hairpin-helix domain-containing protein, partial [Nitrospiraceae bacterium]|nr:helix-hairpin-helix domain-containing protein [Nitrospiraceae bacterium]